MGSNVNLGGEENNDIGAFEPDASASERGGGDISYHYA